MKKLLFIITTITCSFYAFAHDNFAVARIVKAGSHSLQANLENSKKCAEIGAVDITDTMDIKLSANTSDPLICYSSSPFKFLQTGGAIFSNKDTNAASLITAAPSFTIPYGPYWIQGSASYTNASVGSALYIGVGVKADNCGVAGAGAIPVNTGIAYIKASCSYPSSHGPRQSYTEARLEQLYNISYGTVTLQ